MKLIILVLCLIYHVAQCKISHDLVQKLSCKKLNPEYEKCIMTAFKRFMPIIMNGVPDLGIPPLDPLKIPELSINPNMAGIANIKATLTNLEVLGFKNTVFNISKIDPIQLYGNINLSIPWVHIGTNYALDAKMMGSSIKMKGYFEGNFTNIRMAMKLSLTTYKKEDGLDYFKVNKLNQDIKIKNGHIKLTSKDKAFQPIADAVTEFFNSNPSFVLQTSAPMFSVNSVSMTKEQLDKVFGTLPASVLLPE